MTDTQLLIKHIEECGTSTSAVAEELGITRQGLWKKLKNITEFKQSEIEKITRILKLDSEAQRLIFFTLGVD